MSKNKKIPRHIAIIMDGNGRWAKERNLPRREGHRSGAEAVRKTIEACTELKVEFLTLYAFSSENWRRPKMEVKALMGLLERFLKEKTNELQESALTDLGRRGAGHPVSLLPPPREALSDLVALRHLQHHVTGYPLRPDQGKCRRLRRYPSCTLLQSS